MQPDKMVSLLRRIRHDFGNHLQVLSGYLELQQPEKAEKYINKLIVFMRMERSLFETTDGETTLYLYEQLLLARDCGLTLEFKEVDINDIRALQKAGEPLNSLRQLARDINMEELTVQVVIKTNSEQDIIINYFSDAFASSPQQVIVRE